MSDGRCRQCVLYGCCLFISGFQKRSFIFIDALRNKFTFPLFTLKSHKPQKEKNSTLCYFLYFLQFSSQFFVHFSYFCEFIPINLLLSYNFSLCHPSRTHGAPVGELQVLEDFGRDEVQEPASSSSFLTEPSSPPPPPPPPPLRAGQHGGRAALQTVDGRSSAACQSRCR